MEIPSELLKIAKLNERPNQLVLKQIIQLLTCSSLIWLPSLVQTPVNLKCQILVTILHPVEHFTESLGHPH